MPGKAVKYIAFKRKKTGNCLSVLGFTSGEHQFKNLKRGFPPPPPSRIILIQKRFIKYDHMCACTCVCVCLCVWF